MKNRILISILCLLLLCGCANQTASETTEPTESQHESEESPPTEETEVSKHPDMVECASIEGFVTADSNSPYQIHLRKYRNDQTDSYALYIEVNTGQQMIKKELESTVILASPESTLSLGDVDGDGTQEILVHYDTGGLGGFGIWMTWVLKVENDSIHILFENYKEFDTGFESCFLDEYQMEVKNNITGYTLVYSIKDRENLPTHNIEMDPFFVFEPKDVDGDGISEIICKQYSYYSYHNDYAGTACSVLKFNNQTQAFEVIDAWYEPNTEG